ncbi:MAG: hypothetical protein Q4C70_05560, partial [Planctomycetia bacterium]|nr:hypothetical protein [Planctomycetia bacterium]
GAIVALDHSYFVADPVEVLLTNEKANSGAAEPLVNWQSGDAEGSFNGDDEGSVKIQTPSEDHDYDSMLTAGWGDYEIQ